VLENVLGDAVGPPPASVPAVEPDIRGATTIREQLAKHASDATCARCHRRIDPPGFALESFDPIGGFRQRYRSLGEGDRIPGQKYLAGPAVQPGGQMPSGEVFSDFVEFRQHLLDRPEVFVRCLAEKLLIY